jgi:hypothetical protein
LTSWSSIRGGSSMMDVGDDASRVVRTLREARVDPATLRVIEGGAMAATLILAGFPPGWIAERFNVPRTTLLYRVERYEEVRAAYASGSREERS